MKIFLIIFITFSLSACSARKEPVADDYVLIEFASKLEEDYQKLAPAEKTGK